jgi:hypothetical protein
VIQREGRPATSGEQRILARWSGWGAVPEVFDEGRAEHARARAQLAALLTPQEIAAAARSTLNAHYTDAAIVQAISPPPAWPSSGCTAWTWRSGCAASPG